MTLHLGRPSVWCCKIIPGHGRYQVGTAEQTVTLDSPIAASGLDRLRYLVEASVSAHYSFI
jgi:hypothetical protein